MNNVNNNLYNINLLYKNDGDIISYISHNVNNIDFHIFIFKYILEIIQNNEIFYENMTKIIEIYINNGSYKSEFTLYDLYIYSTYVMENYMISYIIFQIIMKKINNYENIKVNIKNLINFNNLLKKYNIHSEKSYSRLCYINSSIDYEYMYSFIYFVNNTYIKINQKIKESNNELLYEKLYIEEINNYYTYLNKNNIMFLYYDITYEENKQIIYDSDYDSNDENNIIVKKKPQNKDIKNDIMHILYHIVQINNENLYEIIIKNLLNNDLSELDEIKLVYDWFRCIYKEDLKTVVIDDNTYIISIFDHKKLKKTYTISYDIYVNDIMKYLNKCNKNVQAYIYNIMNKYVNHFYIPKYEACKNKGCSLCLENIENNFAYCTYCKNYYHNHCYVQLFNMKTNNKVCALCRKDLHKYSIKNTEFIYNLFTNVLKSR